MVQIKDLAQLQGLDDLDAIVELYTLDLRVLDPNQQPFRFCNWAQSGGQPLSHAGETYEPVPIECSGFEINSNSSPSEPRMQVSNVGLTWTGLASRWDDLVGAKLIRRRVLRRYLDDGATPSPTGHWPDEPWFIEQKVSENKLTVTFSLSTAFALDDVKLPKRLALRYTCGWTYRGEGCGYNGYPIADVKDQGLGGPLDPALQAFYDALRLYNSSAPLVAAQVDAVRYWEGVYNSSTVTGWQLIEERYSMTRQPLFYVYTFPRGSLYATMGFVRAYWNGNLIRLDDNYRAAPTGGQTNSDGSSFRPIQRWAWQQGTRDQALAGLNMARANLNSALAVQAQRRQAALALKPAADAVRDPRDQCSKTLTGCRLRFWDRINGVQLPLPTSAFPGLQIG
jgi:lambda family phage minor tail protein L